VFLAVVQLFFIANLILSLRAAGALHPWGADARVDDKLAAAGAQLQHRAGRGSRQCDYGVPVAAADFLPQHER
jgi:hypothetical protein